MGEKYDEHMAKQWTLYGKDMSYGMFKALYESSFAGAKANIEQSLNAQQKCMQLSLDKYEVEG